MNWWKNKRIRLIISVLLSLIILIIIYNKISLKSLSGVFMSIDYSYFAVFFLLIIIQLFIAAFRWNLMTSHLGRVPLRFRVSFEQVVGSYAANMLIPGKLGEVVRIPWMKKYKLKTPVVLLVLLEKMLDIASVIFLMFISLLILKLSDFDFPFNIDTVFYISLILVLGMIFVFLFRKSVAKIIERLLSKKIQEKGEESFYFKIVEMLKLLDSKSLLYFMISVLIWAVQLLQFYFIFLMLNVSVTILFVYAGCSLALLAGALPISVAGLGTRDAVIISFFRYSASIELLAGVGVISLLRIVIPALIGFLFFFKQTKNA
jgi:glycosyltransferase 2 family protein